MPQVPSLKAFRALKMRVKELQLRVDQLEAKQPDWVREEEAQLLTGLSRSTLARERKKPDTPLVWKSAGGLRYLRDSIFTYNEARSIRKSGYQ
jgi:hypothetical protein